MTESPALAPIRESDRILPLDAARGFALLGIFMVNIGVFGEAFGYFIFPSPRDDRGAYEWICWVLAKTFWDGRFYPLFSMLFGMGLVIQYQRAKAAGRSFTGVTIRRLLVLALIGALHALFIWCGDILFLYGTIGLWMVWLVRCSARTLFIIAGSILAIAVTALLGFGLLQVAMERQADRAKQAQAARAVVAAEESAEGSATAIEMTTDDAPVAPSAVDATSPDHAESGASASAQELVEQPEPERSPFFALLHELKGGTMRGPIDPRWIDFETRAYRDGPWLDAFGVRAMTWLMVLVISLFFFGWHVLAMFCLGAALMKCGIFDRSRRSWHWTFVVLALVVALPVSLTCAIALPTAGVFFASSVNGALQLLIGPMLSLGFLGAITLLAQSGMARPVTGTLAAAGRMAFTNYLMQSVIATAIFYHWGLALFDSTTRLERIGIVLAIYALQLVFSVLWLKVFAMGPLEWLWRAATYLRFSPLRRASRVSRASA